MARSPFESPELAISLFENLLRDRSNLVALGRRQYKPEDCPMVGPGSWRWDCPFCGETFEE